jgi:hypothetical protein
MKALKFFLPALLVLFIFVSFKSYAQNEPVLYTCEKYGDDGEEGVSDRFTTGYITVMVKCDRALKLENAAVQYDKYNFSTGKFEFYKKFHFTVKPSMKYIYFSRNDESDMAFDSPGFYRVFLLDEDDDDKTIASCLVEIIR